MSSSSSDERDVLDQREQWRLAFMAKDVDRIMTFYVADPDSYRGFDINPPLAFRGGEEWGRNWETFFASWSDNPTYEFRDARVVVADDLAVVSCLSRFAGHGSSGAEVDMWSRETNVLRKVDGVWLLVHDHVSVPADLATGRACIDLTP